MFKIRESKQCYRRKRAENEKIDSGFAGNFAGSAEHQYSVCGNTHSGSKDNRNTDKKLNIATTIFPEYDWTRAILGDRADDVNLTMAP